jgi:hypothetical protein
MLYFIILVVRWTFQICLSFSRLCYTQIYIFFGNHRWNVPAQNAYSTVALSSDSNNRLFASNTWMVFGGQLLLDAFDAADIIL